MEQEKNILNYFNREISAEDLSNLKKDKDFDTYAKIAHYSQQIDVPKIDVNQALADFKKRQNNTKKQKVIAVSFKQFYKYAAAVVVLLVSSYFLIFNNSNTVATEFAETKTFTLPDDSEVILNSNSEVVYNTKKWEENRELSLEGEAYFKVEKGQKFTVNTSLGDISVLGTQFNVKQRNNFFEVKTFEGLVSVVYQNKEVQLPKGSIFKVINGVISNETTFDINENFWLQNESNFKSTALRFVLQELENQFGYTIKTDNVDLDKLFTGGFSHSDIITALQSVTIPLQLSYKIDDKTVTIYNYGQ